MKAATCTSSLFVQSAIHLFTFLKEPTSFYEVMLRAIPLADGVGCLVPASQLHIEDDHLISLLAKWRAVNTFAFPTRFQVTEEGTRSWLKTQVIDNPHRMLFLLQDPFGSVIGHLGLDRPSSAGIHIDNVIRGVTGKYPGIMSQGLHTLIEWTQQTLLPDDIFLQVLEDNTHAVKFYTRAGFTTHERTPLMRVESEGITTFVPCEKGCEEKTFLTMRYAPSRDEKKLILTAGPSVSQIETVSTFHTAASGWNHQSMKAIGDFEREFANFLGAKHTLATSSCHGALHIALKTLDIGPGDEVIVPDISWIAAAAAVVYVGATPVFADIDPRNLLLDPKAIEEKITPNTRCLIPVHLYGHPCDMDAICAIAKKHNLFVVEDAAPAIGSTCRGQMVGCMGDFGCFSFQGAKLLVTGEGGMLVTQSDHLYEKAKRIADQGRVPGTFWIEEIGYKYKMSNLQAAFGLGQLARIEGLIDKKRKIFQWYRENLPHLELVEEPSYGKSIYWMNTLLLPESSPLSASGLQKKLREKNIDSRPIFPQVSQYPMFETSNCTHAAALSENGLNLPSGVCLTKNEIDYVCEAICALFSSCS